MNRVATQLASPACGKGRAAGAGEGSFAQTPHSDCPHPALRADFSRAREK